MKTYILSLNLHWDFYMEAFLFWFEFIQIQKNEIIEKKEGKGGGKDRN